MAGEFTQGDSHETIASKDKLTTTGEKEEGYATDVPGVNSQDQVRVGTETYPVFDVSDTEFTQNMVHGRKRVRFAADTPAANYMKNSRYNRPFYISNTDKQGKKYTRRIK